MGGGWSPLDVNLGSQLDVGVVEVWVRCVWMREEHLIVLMH